MRKWLLKNEITNYLYYELLNMQYVHVFISIFDGNSIMLLAIINGTYVHACIGDGTHDGQIRRDPISRRETR